MLRHLYLGENMDDALHLAIERAIAAMWINYHESLSLDDLAESAILSKYYFSRVFREVTETTPGRFLAAIRLFRAKCLLRETALNVTDIAYMVGYNSLGTFTTRFTRSVGTSPARFRALSHSCNGLPLLAGHAIATSRHAGTVHGYVTLPPSTVRIKIYLAAFCSPVVEGIPVACTIVDSPMESFRVVEYRLDGLPVGTWHVRATAVAACRAVNNWQPAREPVFLGSGKPEISRAGQVVELNLVMRPTRVVDPPILLALPELDNYSLARPVLSA